MSQLTHILIDRLKKKGIEPDTIPGFIRGLENTILGNPDVNLFQVNKRLHFLGWDDFELDYHTLQLAIACLEAEGLEGLKKEINLSKQKIGA